MTRVFIYFFLCFSTFSCVSKQPSEIKITSQFPVQINEQELQANDNGIYVYQASGNTPTLFNLKIQDKEWEIYHEPNTIVELSLKNDSLIFAGDLITENEHLLSEKPINDEMGPFLENNWYRLHKMEEADFIKEIDSLKAVFINHMEANPKINSSFIDLNSASVDYSFDRMLLRYPRFHNNFTGQNISLSEASLQNLQASIAASKYSELATYKRFAQLWLDKKLEEALALNADTSVYRYLIRTKTALALIPSILKDQELIESFSFEYIKNHIEQCTWLNGKDLLEDFASKVSTPKVKEEIEAYKNERLEARKGLETVVYKTEKDFALEAYIFRPANFDPSKKYAAFTAFHGGGWIVGDASFTISGAQHAAANGLMAFSVEYRLSNRDDISPEEAMEDVRDFIIWLRKNAETYSVDPNRIVAKGLSAGGHLVSSISVLQKQPESIPNAIVLVSPALDTKDGYFKSLLRKEQSASALSPLENLKAGLAMPKTLILQGRTDNLTPTKYAQEFAAKMKDFAYDCELVIYENCGHLFTPSHLDDTGWPQSDPAIKKRAYEKQAEFYKELGYSEIL